MVTLTGVIYMHLCVALLFAEVALQLSQRYCIYNRRSGRGYRLPRMPLLISKMMLLTPVLADLIGYDRENQQVCWIAERPIADSSH